MPKTVCKAKKTLRQPGNFSLHVRTDQVPADTEYAKGVGEAETDGPPPKA